eukprot:GHVQ01007778.1.p1 GENE.GHVQ01007778.1~~GHVQ01007778.1.p1  ORF type:complete len:199 (-),score=59.46 GHVQ01007778.1:99-695(-)
MCIRHTVVMSGIDELEEDQDDDFVFESDEESMGGGGGGVEEGGETALTRSNKCLSSATSFHKLNGGGLQQSMYKSRSYVVLGMEEIEARMVATTSEIADILNTEFDIALYLLRAYRWDADDLTQDWFADSRLVCKRAGLSHPSAVARTSQEETTSREGPPVTGEGREERGGEGVSILHLPSYASSSSSSSSLIVQLGR